MLWLIEHPSRMNNNDDERFLPNKLEQHHHHPGSNTGSSATKNGRYCDGSMVRSFARWWQEQWWRWWWWWCLYVCLSGFCNFAVWHFNYEWMWMWMWEFESSGCRWCNEGVFPQFGNLICSWLPRERQTITTTTRKDSTTSSACGILTGNAKCFVVWKCWSLWYSRCNKLFWELKWRFGCTSSKGSPLTYALPETLGHTSVSSQSRAVSRVHDLTGNGRKHFSAFFHPAPTTNGPLRIFRIDLSHSAII